MEFAFVEDILAKIAAVLPQELQGLKDDTCKNMRVVLQSIFERMDLVTREDFEVQKKILARAQEHIQQLTELVQQLEEKLHDKK
ncbi:MAG: accessory factor UbiK family protein [Gammaproteobacteria bacterium]|nr:accessory factor UbiK family protein [Gammaproteobacteria bacterium]